MKLVSIIIPAWQSRETLPKTLATIFTQTYESIEVIVIDDASTDGLEIALDAWIDDLEYIKLTERRGAPHARNLGFSHAKGEYVMFCDSDLLLKPDAIEKLVATLEAHPEAAYTYPSFRFGWKKFKGGPFDDAKLRTRNFIHTSALIRHSAMPKFDESLKRFQDWDLWLTLLEEGKRGVWYPGVLYRALPRGRLGISNWMPSIWYRIPWSRLGIMPDGVRRYEEAAAIVRRKHGIV